MLTLGLFWVATSLLIVAVGLLIVYTSTMPLARILLGRGISGIDIHKPGRPLLPEMGGLAIILGLTVCSALLASLHQNYTLEATAFWSVVIIAAVVGTVDGLKTLGPKTKIAALLLAAIPILVLEVYTPYPELPFVGPLRLTIIYPIFIVPILITLTANAVNMLDVVNGSMAGTSTIAAIFLVAASVLLGRYEAAVLYSLIAACLFGFYWFNRYPAKVFPGDVGSLSVGAAFAAAAVLGRMEVVTLIALLPALINGSLILSSVGKVFEHRDIKERPTLLLDDGRVAASRNPKAPITLTRLLVVYSPLKEVEISHSLFALSTLSGILALLTAYIMVVV